MNTQSPLPEPAPAPKRRRRRWPKVLLALFVLLLVGVWFAPAIVAKTGLRNWAARKALADVNGTVEVGGASTGWFSAIELRDITVKDAQGRALLTVPRVTSSKTLWSLLRNHADVGEFVVEKPVIEITCDGNTTNLEHAFAKFLNDDSPPKPTRTALNLKVNGGTLTVHDGGKTWRVEALDAAVTIPASRSEPLTAKATAPGLDADASLGERGRVKLAATDFPLDSLAPALRRVEPGVSVGGTLTAGVTVTWGDGSVSVDGSVSARELVVTGEKFKGDRLYLASVELPLKVETVGNRVSVERAELRCDVGSFSAVGEFDPDMPLEKMLDKAGVKLDADIDLAKLAALLPRLLKVREGTAIREGKLTAKLASRTAPTGTVWDGTVRTTKLKAARDGKDFDWPEPLTLDFSGRVAGGLPTFDTFVCKSDFVAVNAQGSPDSFRAAANVYLDKFAARTSDFLDLSGYKLDGQASAWVVVNRTANGDFKANGAVELKEFVFADRTGKGLREPELKLGVWLGGNTAITTRLDTAVLTVAAGADNLDVRLVEPIADASKASAGRVSVGLTGELARWRERAAVFVAIPKHYQMAGTVKATGTVAFNPDTLTAQKLKLAWQNAKFRGAGLNIDEPTMNAVGDLTVKRVAGSAAFTSVTLNSAPLSLTNAALSFEPDGMGDLVISGSGDAVSDLNRLGKTVKIDPDPRGPNALHGRGVGPLRFKNHGDTTAFGGTLDITAFAFGHPEKTGIYEPTLKLELDGAYRTTTDELRFASAKLARPGLAVAGKGTVAKFDTTMDVNLDGTLSYDMAKLSPDIQKSVGGGFQATGQGTKPLSLSGSLSPGFGNAAASLAVSWDSIRSHGFDVGPSELKATLSKGVLSVTPVKATFGGGTITAAPTVRLEPQPAELSLAKGKLVDRAKLTPQVCASALGYALPLIAKATQSEGEITVTIDENRIPLAAPEKATLKGAIVVHKAVVGTGPVIAELGKLLGQGTSMTLASEMTVPVKVENGRVHHENFRVTINGYAVSASGSVGFDGTMAVVADVPIPGTFPGLKNNPTLAKSLTGRVVKVPIGGTVSQPQLDPRAFNAGVETLMRDALKDVGKDLLNKELEKVLPKNLPFPFPFPKK